MVDPKVLFEWGETHDSPVGYPIFTSGRGSIVLEFLGIPCLRSSQLLDIIYIYNWMKVKFKGEF
jgi:hypothetical protein